MRSLSWRPGNWLFGVHPFFAWRPRIESARGYCSLWWLWFELSYADGNVIDGRSTKAPSDAG